MKVFVSSLLQETNTFCPKKTTRELYARGYIYHGKQIRDNLTGTNTEIGGALEYFKDNDVDVIYGDAYWGVAGGRLVDSEFRLICNRIVDSVHKEHTLSGIFFALHGALVAETYDDCEGYLLSEIRKAVGWEIPIVVSLDYHANITEQMVQCSDVMVGFRTYPHTDFADTGKRAASILVSLCQNPVSVEPHFQKIPIIVPVENAETGSGLCCDIMNQIVSLNNQPEIVSASFFCAQPWLDVTEAGAALIAYSTGVSNSNTCDMALSRMSQEFMHRKDELYRKYPSITQVLKTSSTYARPTILIDSGDITTAGGIGDSTVMLHALLDESFQSVLCVVSPKAVRDAFKIGEGNSGKIVIGGDCDYGYNQDVTVEACVIKLTDTKSTILGKSFEGVVVDAGRRAYIIVNGNVHVILTEFCSLMYDPQFLVEMGVDIPSMEFIVQKSHKLFRAAYQNIAKDIVIVDTPGFTDMNIERLQFSKINRPIYPLDKGEYKKE